MPEDNIVEYINKWRKDIPLFATQVFGVKLDAWQYSAAMEFSQDEVTRLAMKACVGPGKSFLLAIIIWWFMLCQGDRGKHPKGAAVAITGENLRDNLWSELAMLRNMSPLIIRLFEMNADKIYARDHQKTWFFSARSFPRKADKSVLASTLSGMHAQFLLFVLDETGDMPPEVLRAAEQAMSTGYWTKIIQAGNPMSREGLLFEACERHPEEWRVVPITADPDDPMRSPRIKIEWAREKIKTYGKDDPWVRYSILGEFPESSINALLSEDEVRAAMKRNYHKSDFERSQKRIGIDVAGEGDDRTVFFPRQGLVAFKPTVLRNMRPNDIASKLMFSKNRWKSEVEFVDRTGGYGEVVESKMTEMGAPIQAVNFSAKADDEKAYFNKRAEMWWRMAEWIKSGGALPNIEGLERELTSVTYTHKNNRLLLERKDQVKERLGFSPDLADALALTFAIAELASSEVIYERILRESGGESPAGKSKHEYDPLQD